MASHPYTTDTSEEALQVQLDGFRKMSPTERIHKMCSLSASLRRMAMNAIRRRFPGIDEQETRLRFIEFTYGPELADAVRDHLQKRADVGDR
ncbi:MAG: hypothetical protein KDB22_18240 [Planctomycetales bacterium]|nr:hypothetical protein [Planctomycetales bacterium]